MATLSALPIWQENDGNGVPYAGGKLYCYEVGTSTPKATYVDYQESSVAAWPLVFDAAGRAEVWLGSGLYKQVFKDANDVTIWTVDGVSGTLGDLISVVTVDTVVGATGSLRAVVPDANVISLVTTKGHTSIADGGGGNFYWSPSVTDTDDGGVIIKPATYAVSDPGRWVRIVGDYVDVKWYGCVTGGSTDNFATMSKAIDYCDTYGKAILVSDGTFYLSADPGIIKAQTWQFAPKGVLKWTGISPVMSVVITDRNKHFDVPDGSTYVPEFVAGTVAYPEWFGAVEGGVTDCAAAFNKTIAAVTTFGGVVTAGKGTWLCGATLYPRSGVSIIGQGVDTVIKAAPAFTGDYVITTDGTVANDFIVKDLYMNGDATQTLGAINMYGSLNIIENVTMDNFLRQSITVGLASTSTASTDCVIRNVTTSDCSSLYILNADNLKIEGCTITGDQDVGILVNPVATGIKELQITGNVLHNCRLSITNNSSGNKLDGLYIKDNVIDGDTDLGISMTGTYSPTGKVTIADNVLQITGTDSTSLYLQATTDAAGSYAVLNNVISPTASQYGIFTNGLTKPVTFDGNCLDLVDGTGFKETGVTDASYAMNTVRGAQDQYDVCQPRYCTLGTDLHSQIDGDTTCTNMVVTGSIINTVYNGLFSTIMSGLDTTNVGTFSSQLKINPGSCNSSNGYLMTLATAITKDATSVWAAGDTSGGRASGVPYSDSSGLHVFIIGKSGNPTAVDAGFDSDVNAVNLLADAASSGYNTYRRVGWVYKESHAVQLINFVQKGDYFFYKDYFPIHSFALSGSARLKKAVYAVPTGTSVQACVALRASTANAATPTNVFYATDGEASVTLVGVLAEHTGNGGWDYPELRLNLWTDSTAQITVSSVDTGETLAPTVPCNCTIRTLGWMDPRGKY